MLRSEPRFVYRARRRKRSVKAGLRAVRLISVPRGSLVRPVYGVREKDGRKCGKGGEKYLRVEASLCGLAS
jgi:hypothetical protein